MHVAGARAQRAQARGHSPPALVRPTEHQGGKPCVTGGRMEGMGSDNASLTLHCLRPDTVKLAPNQHITFPSTTSNFTLSSTPHESMESLFCARQKDK